MTSNDTQFSCHTTEQLPSFEKELNHSSTIRRKQNRSQSQFKMWYQPVKSIFQSLRNVYDGFGQSEHCKHSPAFFPTNQKIHLAPTNQIANFVVVRETSKIKISNNFHEILADSFYPWKKYRSGIVLIYLNSWGFVDNTNYQNKCNLSKIFKELD